MCIVELNNFFGQTVQASCYTSDRLSDVHAVDWENDTDFKQPATFSPHSLKIKDRIFDFTEKIISLLSQYCGNSWSTSTEKFYCAK